MAFAKALGSVGFLDRLGIANSGTFGRRNQLASISPEEVALWIEKLQKRMADENISVQEAHDREFADHPDQGIVLELARQAMAAEE